MKNISRDNTILGDAPLESPDSLRFPACKTPDLTSDIHVLRLIQLKNNTDLALFGLQNTNGLI